MRRTAAIFAVIIAALHAPAARAQQPQLFGPWLSENRRGVIDIYPCGDKVCGRLVWLIQPLAAGKPVLDDKNPKPELRDRTRCNLVMLGDFRQLEPQRWGDGWIYDPDSGKTYSATMFLENAGVLQLRGYVGLPLFGETQTWTRADPKQVNC
jgi:uncharacterized protein (DUF2147 family)